MLLQARSLLLFPGRGVVRQREESKVMRPNSADERVASGTQHMLVLGTVRRTTTAAVSASQSAKCLPPITPALLPTGTNQTY